MSSNTLKGFLFVILIVNGIYGRTFSDVGLNTKELVPKHHYPLEVHHVTTADGYILELHRIPFSPRNDSQVTTKPIALVVPGFLCSSEVFVNTGPGKSLGFIMADQGYDVWMANPRGTRWSRNHTVLNPDIQKKAFWNFSYHEHGVYDLPAFIDYILQTTHQKSIFYIGHSQAVTSFFTMVATRPKYNKKIRMAAMFMGTFYFGHMGVPYIRFLALMEKEAQEMVKLQHIHEILPYTSLSTLIAKTVCSYKSPRQGICEFIMRFLGGYGSTQLSKATIPFIVASTPAGGSLKPAIHLAQSYKSDTPEQFNYGPAKNLLKYGQKTPPRYNIKKITCPVALYYGEFDWFATSKDVDRSAAELPNVAVKQLLKGFNHMDYLWGKDVVELLYNGLFDVMMRY